MLDMKPFIRYQLNLLWHIRGGGKVLEIGGAPTIDNTVRPYYLCTDGGACVSTHTLGGSGDMLPQKNFKNI